MAKASKKSAKGRPAGVRFGKQIAVKLTASQETAWTAAAEARNMGLSVWIRDVVDQYLANQK
jgi:hypothetical protein